MNGGLNEGNSGSYYSAVPMGEKTPNVDEPPGLEKSGGEKPSGRGKGIGNMKGPRSEGIGANPKRKRERLLWEKCWWGWESGGNRTEGG